MQLNLIKSFSAYSFVGFFGAGVNFLILPILSYYLTPTDYGTLSVFNAYVSLAIPFIGLVASGLILVEYYKIKDKEEFASVFSSIQLIPLLPFLFALLVAFFFKKELCLLLELPLESAEFLYLIPVLSLLTIYYESLLSFLVAKKESNLYLIVNVARVLIEVGLTFIFVVYFKWGWKGRILSWFIVTVLLAILSSVYFKANELFTFHVKWDYFKAGVFYGLPLILHTVGKFAINQSDRLFLAKMVGIEAVGIYNIGYQIGSLILIFVTAFQNLYVPYLYERLSNLDEGKKIEILQLNYLFIALLLIILAGITIISPFIFDWLIDQRYKEGNQYVFWTALSYVFWGMYSLFAAYLYFFKRNVYLGYLSVGNVVLNLLLNYVLISRYGPIGAAYATCISFFMVSLVIMVVANRILPLPWRKVNLIFSSLSTRIKA